MHIVLLECFLMSDHIMMGVGDPISKVNGYISMLHDSIECVKRGVPIIVFALLSVLQNSAMSKNHSISLHDMMVIVDIFL